MQVCPRRAAAGPCSGSLFTAKQNGKSAPRPAAPTQLPHSCAWEQCCMLAPPALATQGILRPHCHYWDFALLRHLSTFKPGMSPTVPNFSKFRFCTPLLIILCGSPYKQAPSPLPYLRLHLLDVCSMHLLPSKKWLLFYLNTSRFCSLRPLIDFWGVGNDLVTI